MSEPRGKGLKVCRQPEMPRPKARVIPKEINACGTHLFQGLPSNGHLRYGSPDCDGALSKTSPYNTPPKFSLWTPMLSVLRGRIKNQIKSSKPCILGPYEPPPSHSSSPFDSHPRRRYRKAMPQPDPLHLGGLVSGAGRTLLNIHEHIAAGNLNARLAIVISSRADAPAVARCREAGLRVEVVERRAAEENAFHRRISQLLSEAGVELVCLAGFLSYWEIPNAFAGRVINIHPALLPDFGGLGFYGDRVHRAVLAAGKQETGCTVHFADNEYDHGPLILQRRTPVLPDDTPATLATRVFQQECIAYPEAIRQFADKTRPLPEPSLLMD